MEALKNLIKNLALLFLIGAVPSICWAGELFAAFSLPSLFLLATGVFCALWLKTRSSLQTLKQLLLAREEEWALCEGEQIIEKSSFFPGDSIQAFRTFIHSHSLPEVENCLSKLFKENFPFHTRLQSHTTNAAYSLTGASIEGRNVLFLKNIANNTAQERMYREAQQKSEALITKLQATLETLPLFVWNRDEHQKITYCNAKYADAVQALPTKVYEDEIELIQARTAKTLARKALNMVNPQHIDNPAVVEGDRIYLRIFEVPDTHGAGTVGVAYDITELHDAKKETKQLIEAHGAVLDHLTTAIAVYDGEGFLHYYNQAYVKLHAFNEDFLKTKPRLDEVLEELRSRRQLPEYADFLAYKKRWMTQLAEQREPREDLMHLPDERTLRIFSAPYPLGGVLFMFENITDTLALERTNNTLLDAYQTTLDHLLEGVIIIGSDNRLKSFNPAFLHLWHLTKETISEGEHLGDLLDNLKKLFNYGAEGWPTYKASLIARVTDRLPKSGKLTRKDGIVIDFCYVPLPNGDHLVSYTDSTAITLVQQAYKEKEETLNRITALENVLKSQDILSRIESISNFAEELSKKQSGSLNNKQTNYIAGISSSSNELRETISDILDVVAIDGNKLTLHPTTTTVPSFLKAIGKAASAHASTQEKSVSATCNKEVKDWTFDKKRIEKALLLMLNDLIDRAPLKGKVTLEARLAEEGLEFSLAQSDDTKEPELSPTDLTQDRNSLDGMRLSLAEKIITLHKGRLHAFSQSGGGLRIQFCLPKISPTIIAKKASSPKKRAKK